jgi:hypothetical protein
MTKGMGGRGRYARGTTDEQLLARLGREAERQADYRTTKRIINNTKEKPKMAAPDLSNYVDVATRIKLLIEKYPNASINCTKPVVVNIDGHTFIEVSAHITCGEIAYETAECMMYRTASATAWEPFPGKTPYTRDSEMMNAETSAIGRAIGALGIGLTGSMATANEVANRQGTTTTVVNNTTVTQHGNPPSDKQLWLYKKLLKEAGKLPPVNIADMDKFEVSRAIEALKAGEQPEEIPLPEEEPF